MNRDESDAIIDLLDALAANQRTWRGSGLERQVASTLETLSRTSILEVVEFLRSHAAEIASGHSYGPLWANTNSLIEDCRPHVSRLALIEGHGVGARHAKALEILTTCKSAAFTTSVRESRTKGPNNHRISEEVQELLLDGLMRARGLVSPQMG